VWLSRGFPGGEGAFGLYPLALSTPGGGSVPTQLSRLDVAAPHLNRRVKIRVRVNQDQGQGQGQDQGQGQGQSQDQAQGEKSVVNIGEPQPWDLRLGTTPDGSRLSH
jgi:hypothetical protein